MQQTPTTGVAGKVVVVTGGGTGIGAAVAARYRSEDAQVAVVGRRAEPLQAVAEATGALPITADASDAKSFAAALEDVRSAFGGLDVVVANAGGHGFATVGDTDDAAWQAALQINLTTAFTTARESLPDLIKSQGQMVIVSSLAGLFAGHRAAGYTVGKHALIGLTRTLARDYGAQGVRVNAVCPGWVRTPMADGEMDQFADHSSLSGREDAYAAVTRDVPLRRAAEPAEIAAIVRFLGSGESSYITGAVLVADGGAHVVDVPTIPFEHAGL